jgi:hypothetical protein
VLYTVLLPAILDPLDFFYHTCLSEGPKSHRHGHATQNVIYSIIAHAGILVTLIRANMLLERKNWEPYVPWPSRMNSPH